jgi:tripartite-type tricarboxylate transporter receptor subunit TctC
MALAQKEHLNFNHIPYKGGAPAMLDLLAGRIKVATITFSSGAEQVRSGGVEALGVSTEKRIPDFPDIPTFKELGYDDMVSASWFALSGPLNLPNEIVEKLNREVIKIMQEPEVKKHLAKDAIETRPMTPAQVTAFFESENARWGPVAKTEATKN